MAPSTRNMEQLEQEIAGVRAALSEELAAQMAASMERINNSLKEELRLLSTQLDGKVAKVSERQEKFCEEIKTTLSSIGRDGGSKVSFPEFPSIQNSEKEGEEEGQGSETRPKFLGEFGSTGVVGGMGNNWRFRKLDMPLFDGINPDGWILRAERYFQFYRLCEADKLEAAVVAMEGDALLWYQCENRRRKIRRWEELKGLILRQFRSIHAGSLHEQWLALTQTGTVSEYVRGFIELSAPLGNLPEEIVLGQFINGLKEEVKAEIRVLAPLNVDQAMELALKIEGKLRSNLTKKVENKPSVTSPGTVPFGYNPKHTLPTNQ